MYEVSATELRAKCYAILDNIGPDGVLITKHGKPVATLIPAEVAGRLLIGKLKGRIEIKGSVYSTGAW